MKKYQLTEKLSTEAQNPAFLVGAVSTRFLLFFFSLIISALENNLKTSLKKFAQSKQVLFICTNKNGKTK
jgi:hypothetical protein